MSAAAYRIRKRIVALRDEQGVQTFINLLDDVIDLIDEELEREAEHRFTRPITSTAGYTTLDP